MDRYKGSVNLLAAYYKTASGVRHTAHKHKFVYFIRSAVVYTVYKTSLNTSNNESVSRNRAGIQQAVHGTDGSHQLGIRNESLGACVLCSNSLMRAFGDSPFPRLRPRMLLRGCL